MRRFEFILSVCAVALLATFARAQQIDVAGGAGQLYSTKNSTASEVYLPGPQTGRMYPTFSIDRISEDHFGYSAEIATTYHQQIYNGFQAYRPFFYDVNAVFAPHVAKKTNAIFMGGVGGETVIFYNQYGTCTFAGGCSPRVNSTHFLLHLGAGLSYTVWRHIFVRPEANYYRLIDNDDFHSGNVLRLGVSVGYTFHAN